MGSRSTLLVVLISFLFLQTTLSAQSSYFNLDFEKQVVDKNLPEGWIKWGKDDYKINIDEQDVYSGKSSIVISSTDSSAAKTFGSTAFRIPANYSAEKIVLTGYMKTLEVVEGYAGLILRVDGDNGILDFGQMQKQNINGTTDWAKYEITVSLREEAKQIYVAGILTGKGKAWFDKFEVLLDGKEISQVSQIVKKELPAKLDDEFNDASPITIENTSPKEIKGLAKVAKVWGFLKYHHPEVAKGNYNWDAELIRFLVKKENYEDINSAIYNWVKKLGSVEKETKSHSKNEIKLKPDTDWINDREYLGEDLSSYLQKVKDCKKAENHYYIGFQKYIGNPIFKHEISYSNLNYEDDGLKLIGLFRYWNMIEYFFPYRHLIDTEWDEVLLSFIPKILKADDDLSYMLTLSELVGSISDTHATIWQRDDVLSQYWGLNSPPIKVKFIEDKLVVVETSNEYSLKNEIQIGDVLTHIDDLEIKDIVEKKLKYCPASNLPRQRSDLAKKILRTNNDNTNLSISRDGKEFKYSVRCISVGQLDFKEEKENAFEVLDNQIGYLYPAKLKKGEIKKIIPKISKTKGLIVDMRCYPKDFIVFSLGNYLVENPTPFVKFTGATLTTPGEFSFSKQLSVGKSELPGYKKKIIILVNETTISQSEYTTMAFRVSKNAKVLGSRTAAADGNVSKIVLPGEVHTRISGIGVYYPDGTETQRVGIIPDIEIKPTIQGIKNGEDELLNKAVELILED